MSSFLHGEVRFRLIYPDKFWWIREDSLSASGGSRIEELTQDSELAELLCGKFLF